MFTKNDQGEVIASRGKHRGYSIQVIPLDYLEWLKGVSAKTITVIDEEIIRRDSMVLSDMTLVDKIISVGYKHLASKAHPDKGGSNDDMRELNAAYERIKGIVKAEN